MPLTAFPAALPLECKQASGSYNHKMDGNLAIGLAGLVLTSFGIWFNYYCSHRWGSISGWWNHRRTMAVETPVAGVLPRESTTASRSALFLYQLGKILPELTRNEATSIMAVRITHAVLLIEKLKLGSAVAAGRSLQSSLTLTEAQAKVEMVIRAIRSELTTGQMLYFSCGFKVGALRSVDQLPVAQFTQLSTELCDDLKTAGLTAASSGEGLLTFHYTTRINGLQFDHSSTQKFRSCLDVLSAQIEHELDGATVN